MGTDVIPVLLVWFAAEAVVKGLAFVGDEVVSWRHDFPRVDGLTGFHQATKLLGHMAYEYTPLCADVPEDICAIRRIGHHDYAHYVGKIAVGHLERIRADKYLSINNFTFWSAVSSRQ
jgi:hypothetical protein